MDNRLDDGEIRYITVGDLRGRCVVTGLANQAE
jgi:hypothetical protein